MKNSWTQTFRRLAAGAVVAGATTFSSAMCYAQAAYDDASDPAYAAGWTAGSNGGNGFTGWDFEGSYGPNPADLSMNISKYGGMQAIDSGSTLGGQGDSEHNQIGRAWTLFNPLAYNLGADNPPSQPNLFGNNDIARAGRGFDFPGPDHLRPGNTFSMVIDNPTESRFYGGYIIRFTHSPNGGNSCFAGYQCGEFTAAGEITSRFSTGTFEFGGNNWFPGGTLSPNDTNAGLQIDFTLTDWDSYSLTLTPLDNPGGAVTTTGSLDNNGAGPINWVQVELFNTDSDFYETEIATRAETDFYIRQMSVTGVVPEPGTGALLVLGGATLLGLIEGRRRQKD
jgi:hypothetical protein